MSNHFRAQLYTRTSLFLPAQGSHVCSAIIYEIIFKPRHICQWETVVCQRVVLHVANESERSKNKIIIPR